MQPQDQSRRAANRTIPRCPYFGVCGGCIYQDQSYPEQLRIKYRLVAEALEPFQETGGFEIKPMIESPKPYHYRHMISLTVRKRASRLELGFVGHGNGNQLGGLSRSFVPIESCAIADDRLNQYLPEALARLEVLPPEKKFRTSQLVLRVGSAGEVVTSLREDRKKALACALGGRHFGYAGSAFFQHNFSILPALLQTVRSFLQPEGSGALIDLYSGVGMLSISLASGYERVFGIEEGYEAMRHSANNARLNGADHFTVLEGRVEKILPEFSGVFSRRTPLHVIADPPRTGLASCVIRELTVLPVEKLVYVSCDPAALARDVKALSGSFRISGVQPLDLFPQTKHVETVVLLRPRSSKKGDRQ